MQKDIYYTFHVEPTSIFLSFSRFYRTYYQRFELESLRTTMHTWHIICYYYVIITIFIPTHFSITTIFVEPSQCMHMNY